MICPKCNQFVPDGSRFCQSCGANLMEAAADVAAGVEPEIANIVDGKEPAPEAEQPVQESSTQEPSVQEASTQEVPTQEAPTRDAPVQEQPIQQDAQPGVNTQPGAFAGQQPGNYAQPGTFAGQQPGGYAQPGAFAGQQPGNYAQPGTFAGQQPGNYAQQGAFAGQQMAAGGSGPVKKGVSKPVLFGLIGGGIFLFAAAITLLIVFLVVGNKTTYNLKDYTNVTFEGVDGSGTARAELNEDLATEIAENMGLDLKKLQNQISDISDVFDMASGNMSDIMLIYAAFSSVELKLDKAQGLKNGDTVTVTYSFNAEKAKDVKAEFVGDPYTVTVSGLNEVREIDPFEDLEVTFEGTSPNAYVNFQIVSSEAALSGIWFNTNARDGLKVGDTVTLTVEGYDEESFIQNYGVKFSQTEKTYTVEDVEAYLTVNQAIEVGALDLMKTATEGYIDEYFEEGSRKEYVKASDVTYEGYYFLTNRNEGVWSGFNKAYVVYSATVSSRGKDKLFKPTKVYFPVEYDDIKQLNDGGFEIDTAYKRILGSTDLQFGYWETVSGYTDKEVMFAELVGADETNYDGVAYDGLQ